jgi:hypothetical protein
MLLKLGVGQEVGGVAGGEVTTGGSGGRGRWRLLWFLGFRGSGAPWLPALEKKVRGGRNQQAVGGDVWAAGKAAGSRRSGWWLPAVGSGPERGHHIRYVRRGLCLRGLEARRPTVEAGETASEWRRQGHQTGTG